MSDAVARAARDRGARRKAQTRATLIRAAQRLIAEGRTNVAVLEITQAAEIGSGSFYNHFATKEELFEAAVDDALELQGQALDVLTADLDDPADAFARSYRLTGRMHRVQPELSKVILSRGPAMVTSEHGLGPRALRDIVAATEAGRFTVSDPQAALLIIGGAAMTLGQYIHDHPEIDDAALTDQVTEDLLRMLGLKPRDAAAICAHDLPDVPAMT
jgi:AcrR family transcriptional regulator